ncbi:MAG TPA: SDR family oxidoreductase [Chroococcales cyanobacterium]
MKIVVVGASGLIGKNTVERLRKLGHDVVPASRSSGVNTVTGEGLAAALKGADVVLDVSNSPSWEDKAVMEFFESSTRNLLAAEASAGVKHHVALSVVGTADLQDSGYFRAKQVQENLIKAGRIPYTIVQATQFFEFVGGIADAATSGDTAHVSTAYMQPIAANDVAEFMAATCIEAPINGTVQIGGPKRARQTEFVETYLKATGDSRKVTGSADAIYFGVKLNENTLVPGPGGKSCPTSFEDWLKVAVLTK